MIFDCFSNALRIVLIFEEKIVDIVRYFLNFLSRTSLNLFLKDTFFQNSVNEYFFLVIAFFSFLSGKCFSPR